MVKIKATDGEFVIEDYNWSGTNAETVNFLNARLSVLGPAGYDPDPDHTAALDALLFIGGEIVKHDELSYDPDAIY